MVDVIFGGCTMCGRCSVHCSIGLDIPFLVRTARAMLVELDLVPEGLQSTVEAAIDTLVARLEGGFEAPPVGAKRRVEELDGIGVDDADGSEFGDAADVVA